MFVIPVTQVPLTGKVTALLTPVQSTSFAGAAVVPFGAGVVSKKATVLFFKFPPVI